MTAQNDVTCCVNNRGLSPIFIGDRLHVMIYCRRSDAVRVISLRKANRREEKRYAET